MFDFCSSASLMGTQQPSTASYLYPHQKKMILTSSTSNESNCKNKKNKQQILNNQAKKHAQKPKHNTKTEQKTLHCTIPSFNFQPFTVTNRKSGWGLLEGLMVRRHCCRCPPASHQMNPPCPYQPPRLLGRLASPSRALPIRQAGLVVEPTHLITSSPQFSGVKIPPSPPKTWKPPKTTT